MRGLLINEYSKLCKDNVRRQFYVYEIKGTASEIETFENSDEAQIKDDNGNPLWITSRDFVGCDVNLVWRKDGKLAIDTSEIRKMASLAKAFGPAGNSFLADYINKQMRKPSNTQVDSKVTQQSELDLNDL